MKAQNGKKDKAMPHSLSQNENLTILLALEVLGTLHSLLQIWAEVRVHSWHSSWVTHIKLITFYRTFILQIKRDMSQNMVHCSHYMCSSFSSHSIHSHPKYFLYIRKQAEHIKRKENTEFMWYDNLTSVICSTMRILHSSSIVYSRKELVTRDSTPSSCYSNLAEETSLYSLPESFTFPT